MIFPQPLQSLALLCPLLCLTAPLVMTDQLGASEPIAVELQNGRTYSGVANRRSDEQDLWLRYGSGTITVLRPLPWKQVVAIHRGGEALAIKEFRQGLLAMRPASAADSSVAGVNQDEAEKWIAFPPKTPSGRATAPTPAGGPTMAARAQRLLRGEPSRVTHVHFDAQLANWDADAEQDGLLVRVFPLNKSGHFTPVDGTVEVTLTGVAARVRLQTNSRHREAKQLGRWTLPISKRESDPLGAAIVRVPFQAIHPERNPDVAAHGQVYLRVHLPGHGVFEAKQEAVRIRPYVLP